MRNPMKNLTLKLSALTLTAASLFAGCLGVGETQIDYYSDISDVCLYKTQGSKLEYGDAAIRATSLTPACKTALEQILPLDESWAAAPAGLKDKMLESFQAIAAYPITMPPRNRILGTVENAIPLSHLCILVPQQYASECGLDSAAAAEPANPNRNLFNYVINRLDRISYQPDNSVSYIAHYGPTIEGERQMMIANAFWDGSAYENIARSRFIRASTLIHETRHSENIHGLCEGTWNPACDPDMNGPYGLEITWMTMLLHGSQHESVVDGSSRKYTLSDLDVSALGSDICWSVGNRLLTRHPGLTAFLETNTCSVNSAQTLAREGLSRPSTPSASSSNEPASEDSISEVLGRVMSPLQIEQALSGSPCTTDHK